MIVVMQLLSLNFRYSRHYSARRYPLASHPMWRDGGSLAISYEIRRGGLPITVQTGRKQGK